MKPTRTLRNEIARHVLDGSGWDWPDVRGRLIMFRDVLEEAGLAVDAIRDYVLVFGPTALIEAL